MDDVEASKVPKLATADGVALPAAPEVPPDEDEPQESLIDYLQSEKGHQVVTKALDIFSAHQNAANTVAANIQQTQLNYQNSNWKLMMGARLFVFAFALSTAAVLAWHGRLDGAVGTLIGTLVGYFLGRGDRA